MPDGVYLTWVWGIALISLGVGIGVGIAYLAMGSCRRARELATKLEALQKESDAYREEVAQHFLKTSQLVHRMTDSYRDVYQHLATGSESLCKEPLSAPRLDIADSLSAESKRTDKIAGDQATHSFSEGATNGLEDVDADAVLGDSPRVPDLDRDAVDTKTGPKRRTPST